MAPESIEKDVYNEKTDVDTDHYSPFGCWPMLVIHCKNLRVVLTFYGYLSCTFYEHPVSDWDVPFTMAT